MSIHSTLLRNFIKCGILFIMVLSVKPSQAQYHYETPYTEALDGASGQLVADSSREVVDSVYMNKSSFPGYDSVSISNFITLYIDELSTRMPPDSFKLDVDVRIYFLNRDSIYDSIASKVFTIEYNKNRAYNSKAIFYFKDAYRVKMKVLSVTESYAALANILPLVKLQNNMVIKRIFTLDCSMMAVKTIGLSDASANITGELAASWSELTGALEYDLEWTFADQTALDAGWYNTGGVIDPEKVFRNNATRVTVFGTTYNIPLLYEGDGKLFARVRAAQIDKNGERKTTNWSSDYISDGGFGQYTFVGHERTLNWQASTSFAEDGKRKSVVQYFDGTLRNRQTVTKDNTTDSTLTAETFYDKQGRAVVQVLPAPTLSSIIKYTPLFNKAPGGIEYDKEKYDGEDSEYCSTVAVQMDSSSGTAKYYSYNNPNRLNGIHQYLPQAKGYPFTEVKYTQDNTGRIAAQGGVGPTFQLNSGHETKYYYGTPEQSDLDALFGTEAGYASHYQKNVVRDANGQYSVSYVDMHGRTVATALAGEPPAGLLQLSSYSNTTRTDSLISSKNNLVKENSIVSVKTLLVTKTDSFSFRYELNAESLQLPDKDNVEICYDCLYDLTITISDDCGNQSFGGHPLIVRDSNMRVAPPLYDTTCAPEGNFLIAFDTTLQEGNYTITKVLTLREDARDWYRDSLYAPHNTVKTKQDIINDQLEVLRSQREANCEQVAEPWYPYQQYRERMLIDLTPEIGQYAEYNEPGIYSLPSVFQIYSNTNTHVYTSLTGQNINPDQFIMNFQPEWAEQMLTFHPEYKKLAYYEALASSYHWDADFEATDTYAQAFAKGYLNPTNRVGSPTTSFGNGNDSVIFNMPSGLVKTTLEDSMLNYKKDKYNNVLSLWAMASIAGHCDLNNETCINGFRTTPSSLFGSSMCEGEKDMAWRYFRNEYLRLKRDWITAFVNNKTNYIELSDKAIPVFPIGTADQLGAQGNLVGNDLAAAQQAAADSMNISADRNCREYAKQWWVQLGTCNYSTADSLKIVPRLVEICKLGTDSTHPFGATGIPPGKSYTFRSFDELITHYNDSTGKPNDAGCNAFLIDAPGAYVKPFALVDMPTYSKPDSCTCDKITGLYSQYQAVSVGYNNFSDYVQQKLHTTITQNAIDSLLGLCTGAIECRYIPNMIMIPPALQCNTSYDICVDCNQVNSVFDQFKNSFPGIIPGYADTTVLQRDNNALFSKYMNNKLGFSKSTIEYLQFLDTCGATIATSCDSLQSLIIAYRQIDSSCTNAEFVTYFNQQKSTSYTFSKVDSIYFESCQKHLNICGGSVADTLNNIVDQFVESRIACYPDEWRIEYVGTAQYYDSTSWLGFIADGATKVPDSTRILHPGGMAFSHRQPYAHSLTGKNFTVETRMRIPRADTSAFNPNLQMIVGTDSTYINVMFWQPGSGNSYWGPRLIGGAYDFVYPGFTTHMYPVPSLIREFQDWAVFKIEVINDSVHNVYFNDLLVLQLPFHGKINVLKTVSLFTGEYNITEFKDVNFDYIKIYDSEGNIIDYVGFDCQENCDERFKNYYNQTLSTAYSYSQIDSIYSANGLVLTVCNPDTASVRCDQLDKYVDLYKQQYITPASGYVDLDMRTFAGNKTPDEGPKGVFDVKGKLIGNTVDSTPRAIKESYVSIWNSSADNRAIGALHLLQNDKFRLVLNAGKQAPCEGIIGQRYYQVDAYTNELDGLVTGTGTYIDFGDSTSTKVNDLDSNAVTVTTPLTSLQPVISTRSMPGFIEVHSYYTTHIYSTNPTHKVVTIYHSDFKGRVGFDCFAPQDCGIYSNIRNLRGYFPQELRNIYFHTTHDSTLNNFSQIRNFDQITTLQSFSFSGHSSTGFRNNRLPDFKNNKGLKAIAIENDPGVPIAQIRPIEEYFSGINTNYPELSSIVIRPYDTSFARNLHFNIPSLRSLGIQNSWIGSSYKLTTADIDQIINEIASSVVNDSGNLQILPYDATQRSSASDSAVAKLTAMHWRLIGAGMNNDVPFATFSTLVMPDTTSWLSSFSDYINSKLGTNFTLRQIDSFYLARCGHKPDYCVAPDTSLPTNVLLCGKSEPYSQSYSIDDLYDPPCSDSTILAYNFATERYSVYKDSLDESFNKKYNEKCLAAASVESFTVSHPVSEYHYTLYYYDQAGNLVKTVAPAGVQAVYRQTWLDSVWQFRNTGARLAPPHDMPTVYRYNSLNQVVSQQTPDAGKSTNWYDKLGRLAVSQNAKQVPENKYSYTLYDPLGRIVEVGQKFQTTAMTNTISRNPVSLANWVYYNNGSNHYPAEMVTQTIYDEPAPDGDACVESLRFIQKSYTMRNRVSYTRYYEKPSYYYDAVDARYYISPATFITGIDYSYDIHGNVDTMRNLYGTATYSPMNKHPYNGCKTIAYTYDLISGKVNQVHYNPGENDEFYHRYAYDAENRLTEVYTTDNKAYINVSGLEEREAIYSYYQHGPLARTMLGQQVVQGIDYAYTLQGWLKGVNSSNVWVPYDMGRDGLGANNYNAADAYGYTLDYYSGDYRSINYGTVKAFADPVSYFPGGEHRPLYNGNISSMTHSIPARFFYQLYNYQYDQLNRLVGMDMYRGLNGSTNLWNSMTASDLYKERYTYDGNGNIKTAFRNGNLSMNPLMDSLTYFYKPGTNQLDYIRDRNNDGTAHNSNYGAAVDIKDQASGNYNYDGIGNMIYDRISGVDSITWNVYGKIQHLYKQGVSGVSNTRETHYYYDPSGNRVGKAAMYTPSSYNAYTWYVRDAQGNVLAVYETTGSNISTSVLKLTEHHIYGSSRLGIIARNQDVEAAKNNVTETTGQYLGTGYLHTFTRGSKFFELTNHLGNVLVTVSDDKTPSPQSGNPSVVGGYTVKMVVATDHTPFGMIMQGRNYNNAAGTRYRYGFNGKEMDNEVKGTNNQIDYGFRIYDPRAGKFLSVDPLTKEYPELTPYQFASNTPIQGTDLDGLEISYHYDDPRFGVVIMPAGDNLRRQVPPEHLKYLPQLKYQRSQGIMSEHASMVFDNVPGIGTFKGAVEGVIGYDAAGNKLSAFERATGFVPYFGKAKKTLKVLKAADKVDDAKDLSKAVNKIDDAVSNEKAIVKNKNAKDAEGEFILYDVHEKPGKQGELLKVGKADEGRKRASGVPDRMAVSQRKARKAGYPEATATPRKKLGKTTTGDATKAEAAEVRAERAAGNELPLNKEKDKRYRND